MIFSYPAVVHASCFAVVRTFMCILCAFVISLCAHSVLMIFSYPAVVHASCFAVVRSTFVAFALVCILCAFVTSLCAHGIAVVCSTLFVLHFCVRSGSLAFHWEVLCCKVLPDFRL